jgi:hypothetical protein
VTQEFVPEDEESVWDLRFARHTMKRYGRDYVKRLDGDYDFLLVSDGGRQALRLAPLAVGNAFSVPVGGRTPLGLAASLAPYRDLDTTLWYGGSLIAPRDDAERTRTIHHDLLHLAESAGCEVYAHRSFLDGFAWDRGQLDRFGLVHIADDDRARTPNDSAFLLKDAAENGAVRAGAVARFVARDGENT